MHSLCLWGYFRVLLNQSFALCWLCSHRAFLSRKRMHALASMKKITEAERKLNYWGIKLGFNPYTQLELSDSFKVQWKEGKEKRRLISLNTAKTWEYYELKKILIYLLSFAFSVVSTGILLFLFVFCALGREFNPLDPCNPRVFSVSLLSTSPSLRERCLASFNQDCS